MENIIRKFKSPLSSRGNSVTPTLDEVDDILDSENSYESFSGDESDDELNNRERRVRFKVKINNIFI
jgi:hypothetical protein